MQTRKVPLALLSPGDAARVVDVLGEGAFRRRLLDMGFINGAFIHVIKHAPLGTPVEYSIGGTHVTLRKEEAMHIVVEQVPLSHWRRRHPLPPERRRFRLGPGRGRRWRRGSRSR